MSRSRLYSLLSHVHRTQHDDANGLPDAQLLERFARLGDEAAFELLVWRHERMVLGVCRRLLRDEHDAEDAFQAAFLTLARKAASIGRREAVASWLYKVAYRCALRLRESVHRQRQGVVRGVDPAGVAKPDSSLAAVEQRDLRELLDEEVQRLPPKYRAAIVLCYLEGKSYQKAAEELGCPAGTLSARLHQARERLRRRLTARGVAPAVALAVLEGARETQAAARLAAIAVQAARRVLDGQSTTNVVSSRTLEVCTEVMQTMSASKPKIVAVVLFLGCLTGMSGWAAWRVSPQAPREQHAESTDKPVSAKKEGKTATWHECARLRGSLGSPGNYVDFSPDGTALASVGPGAILRLWNTSNWELRWQYDCSRPYGEQFGYLTRFSPDGRLIGITGTVPDADKPGQRKEEIILLDASTGRERARLPGGRLSYASDRVTAAACYNDCVTLWDLRTLHEKCRLKTADPLWNYVVTFSKDSSLLCASTQTGRCYLWETATGKERASPQGFRPQFSPDGKMLLTILPGGIVKLWDTANGRERATIRNPGRIGRGAKFSADGKHLLVPAGNVLKADGYLDFPKGPLGIHPIDVRFFDPRTGAEQSRLPGECSRDSEYADFALGGRIVVYERLEQAEIDRHEVVLWDVEAGKERAVLRAVEGVRYSGDMYGTMFLTDGPNPRLWDAATGRRLLDLPAGSGVKISPDGQWLASFAPRMAARTAARDIRIFRFSAKTLPSPVIRDEAAKSNASLFDPPKTKARRALDAVRQEAEKFDREALPKIFEAKTEAERDGLFRERKVAYVRFDAKYLKVARDFPADPEALEALELVLESAAGIAEGEIGRLRDEALALIRREHRRSSKLTDVVFCMKNLNADSAENALADLAQNSPHRSIRGRAAWQLAQALADKSEHARLFRALPELLGDPVTIGQKYRLQRAQKIDPDAVARSAEEWYVKVCDHYADVPVIDRGEKTLGESAESGLFVLRKLALGKVAPDIEGEDLEGKRFHLNEYRGKVVVLMFCGHWCGPCRQMNPQKQQLIERHVGKPFALLEVNSDDDPERVRRIMRKEKLTWRCWFDGGREGPIARRWGISGWPRIFLLDAKGVIRYKELRGPMLDRVVDRLLKETGNGK